MMRFAMIAVTLAGCAETQVPPAPDTAPPPLAGPRPGVPPMPGVIVPRPNPLPDGSLVEGIDSCGLSRIGDLVGKPISATLSDDARKRSGARTIRVIRPGTMVTMDFRPDRLNIEVDDKDMVTRFRCG